MTQDDRPELPRPPETKQVHHHTLDSETYGVLVDGPKTASELPTDGGISARGGQHTLWEQHRHITPPRRSMGTTKSRPPAEAVYYLYGDERRAVRKFIEVNEDYVSSCMADTSSTTNPLQFNLTDSMWRLFCIEWEYYRRHGGFGGP